MLDLDQQKISN